MSKSAVELVATFAAAPGETFTLDVAARALAAAGADSFGTRWLGAGVALDLYFTAADPPPSLGPLIEHALGEWPVDVIVQPLGSRRKALLVADMDATIIAQECLDELARTIGQGEKVAALTAAAMRGEIDFEAALTTRVALFAGVDVATVEEIVERLTPNSGAQTLVATMRAHGAHTALVSGGFTLFAAPIGRRLRFDEVFANRLEIDRGRLTGRITPPIQGAEAKGEVLTFLRDARGLSRDATLAVGDGANDIEMLGLAGLGVAYHAKPQVAAKARARLNRADLTALLYAQGYTRKMFVEA
jgi:phosphoserine phosphatase